MAEKIKNNRDLFLKFSFMYFLAHILKVLGIDEEIEEIMPTEMISFKKIGRRKIFDNFLDFHVVTKSEKILIFEFKKNPLTKKDLKQAFEYYDRFHCQKKADVKLIIILLSKDGKIKEYTKLDITYHPQIIKTKKINKQKPLSSIRDKLQHNKKLTEEEISLLITLPLFDIKESEADITEEICGYVKFKRHCIPENLYGKMVLAMFLNIEEYVDEEKKEKLLEMINMAEAYQGVISEIRNEARNDGLNEGRNQGRKSIISRLLKKYSVDEVAELLEMKSSEILSIINKVD
ncbi:hypothetical protein [Methanobrevibacter sp. UBA212]|uniref:hypothetical protein n=1 Tax=Methanobrevibacter sp. UBA212 TaxID=1915476 RepID=UPI0025EFF6FD|nr:hypothetical protein [Methanobrevibacter sp. UBA212]